MEEGNPLPQLVIIDGGKGQLGAAMNSIRALGLEEKITLIGIAKRLEEIFYPGDPVPLYLDKNSSSLKIIQHLRNEAHRFGITFHRNQRSKGALSSELDSISGIGEKSIEALIKRFKSVSGIKEASFDELKDIVGLAKAKLLKAYFSKEESA